MSNASSWVAIIAFVLLSLLMAGTVQAHSRASRRHEPVALRLHIAEANTSATVETAEKAPGPLGRVVLRCKSVCDAELPRGKYKLILERDGEPLELDSEVVSLQRPLQITAEEVNIGLRALGMTLLITGAVVGAGGLVATFPSLLGGGCQGPDTCDPYLGLARVGFIAALSGGVMALVGLLFYFTNRSSFRAKRLKAGEGGMSMQLAPTPSGMIGLLRGAF